LVAHVLRERFFLLLELQEASWHLFFFLTASSGGGLPWGREFPSQRRVSLSLLVGMEIAAKPFLQVRKSPKKIFPFFREKLLPGNSIILVNFNPPSRKETDNSPPERPVHQLRPPGGIEIRVSFFGEGVSFYTTPPPK